MNCLNWILFLTSLNVVLVSVERFSFTTRVLLPPADFLRLHEVFQMTVVILITVVLPCFLLRLLTDDFRLLPERRVQWFSLVFAIGIYFYATGNGLHELASFELGEYCDPRNPVGRQCQGLFFNDFYWGNGLYFFGALLMNMPLLLLERMRPSVKMARGQWAILVANAVVFALAILAYAGFDRVLVGLVYSLLMLAASVLLLVGRTVPISRLPLTVYTVVAYGLGCSGAAAARLLGGGGLV
ncbi:MAG: hypothetical protein U0821_26305 [Chloroflexota bacterium]